MSSTGPDRPPGVPVALALLALGGLLLAGLGAAAAPTTPVHPAAGAVPYGPNETVSGVVLDAYSRTPLPNVTLHAIDYSPWPKTARADAEGRFTILSVPGTVYLTVDPPPGYAGVQVHVPVGDGPVTGVVIVLLPSAAVAQHDQPSHDVAPVAFALVLLPIFGLGAGLIAARRRQLSEGRPRRFLSRFAEYVTLRAFLIPVQLLVVLVILYVFGSYLPALAIASRSGCLTLSGNSCAPCDPAQLTCQLTAFSGGLSDFLVSIFTGQWGLANFGNLRLPAIDFIEWWLPNSLELAAVALTFSVLIGYPLGLAAGWRADGLLDRTFRGLSILFLLIPTFLVVLFLLTAAYEPWLTTFGDSPYGLYPSSLWFLAHGGFRPWIGIGGNTGPTGFPIVDGALRGDWGFVEVVGSKLVVQALAIAIIYVSIFFRFARHAVAEAARSEAIRAARSRGVPERTLAWHHSGRRVLPVLVLIFGMTLPVYLGTQALVEVLFNDSQGFGSILFSEMTQVASSGFGFNHRQAFHAGNLYQVTIFFLALLLLVGNLCADVLARYLDHSLEATEAE